MDRWKATALVLIGVVLGMVYGSACSLSATAAGSATGASRAVLYLSYDETCPEGFSNVGEGWTAYAVTCLED
tara:strand:+ start:274 stop:489 length:216 start_codon:yes stop_codon:yes gene_type:complete